MKQKSSPLFVYEGLGFPVHLLNVPMIKTRGEWIPDINYEQLQKAVLVALAQKPFSLTGNEIRFIRHYFEKTLTDFGREFGVSHAAVIEWQNKENDPIKMNPATEKCIRLFILDAISVPDKKFREFYHHIDIKTLAEQKKAKNVKDEPLTLDTFQVA